MKQQAEGTARVPILVATTRKKAAEDPGEMFGGERAEAMSYAAITVSIPNDRKVGQVQWPASLPGDPKRDFMTASADYIDQRAFAASIAETARRTKNPRVLIFVHGFNNRFDDSVYRFAQIVHDSKAEAVPVLFTWPSRGDVRLRSYTYDRESANYSRDALEGLIDQIASYPHIKEIHLLAHSMGSYVTLEALRGRSLRRTAGNDKVKQAMLVAPDIDVDVFRATLKRMGPNRPKMMLFASQDDGALSLSKEIWGGVDRIGEVGATEPYRTELEGQRIAVYDLTPLRTKGGSAHSRAFDDIGDVMELVRQRNMQERGGTQVARGGQPPILAAPAVQTETAALRE
jgi:esterase/lipase superfamily enzyme